MKQIHIFTVFSTPYSFFDGQFGYLSNRGYEIVLICSNDSRAAEFANRNGIRFIPQEIPRNLSIKKILKAFFFICAIIKEEKPNAVFGHTPVGALVAMAASKICGVNNRVYYRHGLIYTTMKGLKRTVYKLEEQFVSSLASSIINVSPSLSKLSVIEHLNSEKKQCIIGYGTCGGIDAENLFNPDVIDSQHLSLLKKQLAIDGCDLVFGFCGRICNDKGIPELVDGFKLFKKRHQSLHLKLVIIGKFDERDDVSEQKKNEMRLDADIVITGYIEKKEIQYYYYLLDVFVFPSHREGFGMCAVEAAAMEKPVLVSRSHGCIDTIIEHVTGEFIDSTVEGVCKGMELMLNKNLREQLGKNGRQMVLDRYDNYVMWPKVEKVYQYLLK